MNWKSLFVCFISFASFGQSELAFRNYTLESGLPSNTVYECFQNKKGEIFIGHNSGCSVFNGLAFQTPIHDGKPTALSNFISFENGQLMLRNFQGKQFILTHNKLIPFQNSLKESWGFPTYLQDGESHYVFQGTKFYTMDEKGKGKPIPLPSNVLRIYHGIVLKNRAYFFVSTNTSNKLICFDLKTNRVIHSKEFTLGSNVHLFKGRESIIWLDDRSGNCGTYTNGFVLLTNLYSSALPKDSKITSHVELDNGDKLICTFNGVYRLNSHWQFVRHYLDGIQCTHLLLDKDNGLWISSLQNGLFYVSNTEVLELNSSSINGRNVKFSKVYIHENKMYIGTYDGRILILNSKGELEKTFDFDRNVETQSMFIQDNKMYVYCGGLLIVDAENGKIEKELITPALKSIARQGDELIGGSSKGLIFYKNEQIETYLDTLWIKQVLPVSNDIYILECTESIFAFNRLTKKLRLIQAAGANVCPLGDLWYFRTANGVFSINSSLKSKKIYHSRSTITELYLVDDRLNIDLEDSRSLELSENGSKSVRELPKNDLNDVMFVGEFGEYRVKGNSSAIQMIPKSIEKPNVKPFIHLISERGNYTIKNGSYILPYSENELTLNFDILPNYHYNSEGKLFYRILELNKQWKVAQTNKHYIIELLRIPPGDFTLEFYAESDGGYSSKERFQIHVKHPFYFRWWFIALFFGLIIAIAYVVVRWKARLNKLKNQRIIKEQQLKMKALSSELVAIRSQMNPHFIFNSLSSIQTKILNEERVEAYKNVNTFATLLRQALQFTSKEFITLQEELDFTRNYILLEQTRTSNAFEYVEEIDTLISADELLIPSLFLQPFIENAIRHGLMHSKSNKKLRLRIQEKEFGLEAVIEDNGIGRLASNEINTEQRPDHISFATKAIQDRIEILKEANKMDIDLQIEDLPQGTRVVINFKAL